MPSCRNTAPVQQAVRRGGEQLEKAYRAVPADLDLTETVSIRHTRKVARDNAVKYHWRVLQLLPGAERPSYAGLRVEVLEQADGELLIRYMGEAVDYQEALLRSPALWREGSGTFPLRKNQRQLKSGSPDIWIETRRSSWLPCSPRCRSGPRPRGCRPGIPFATSCNVRLLPPSRPDGRRCSRPGSRDCPAGHRSGTGHVPRHRREIP